MSVPREVTGPEGAAALLAETPAVVVRGLFSPAECATWSRAVRDAETDWTAAFDGEQYSLGRAFYTHLEEDRTADYFADAAASDARVERWLPGLQARLVALVGTLTGGRAVRRRGWCGPGVHVFPPREKVARKGGVHHFDTEGLGARHRDARLRALTAVAMFQPATEGGGLAVWDVLYRGEDHPSEEELARGRHVVEYGVGDVVVIDSYRLHQIQPFRGGYRISATVHAAETDRQTWECWF